jgi:ankyrin repeat protein
VFFSSLNLQIASQINPRVAQLCIAETEDLETALDTDEMSPVEEIDHSNKPLLIETRRETSPTSFFSRNTTLTFGPLVPLNRCLCQCHNEKFNIIRSELEARLPKFFVSATSRCTNFECCARRYHPKRKIIIPSNWLRRLGISSIRARKAFLRNSLPVREILSEGSDVNRYAKTGNVEGLRRLIAARVATPSATTPDGWTLLHGAVYNGQIKTVEFLLSQKADLDATEDGNRRPGDLARVRALIFGATDIQKEIASKFPGAESFQDDYELTPIHVAVLGLYDHDDRTRPDLSTILEFIDDAENAPPETDWKKFCSPEERKKSPLFANVVEIYAERARSPTSNGAICMIDQPDKIHGWTPFLWASFTGRREALEILIKSGADPFTISAKKRNALHLAAESKRPEVMSYVLERPSFQGEWFDINRRDYWKETPLHVASSGSAECVRLLLDSGADRYAKQETGQVPLHYASLAADKCEKIGIVDLLSADNGSHINHQDEESRTPIFDLLDTAQCVELLISRGANVNIRDKNGKSLIHHAAIEDAAGSLRILLTHSESSLAIAPDKDGCVPIALAFEYKSSASAKLLVENNAIGDFHGKDGWDLVHHASKWGNADVLEAVLKHPTFLRGARTPKAESAADIAKAEGNWKGKVRQLLKEYDSKGQVAASEPAEKSNQT